MSFGCVLMILTKSKAVRYGEKWPSGQWQQTVNLSAQAFAGSNPAFSTIYFDAVLLVVIFKKLDVPKIQNPFQIFSRW
jgi:hypothetical protein